jgi:hypothetical protein
MRRIFELVVWCACLSFIVPAANASAADAPDFSGKYVLHAQKNAEGDGADVKLNVAQSATGIEVSQSEKGKTTTNLYPLGGLEGDYVSPGGPSGKCKAYFKGKYLFLESVVITRPASTGSPVHVHTTERWQLSSDAKTLTIRTDVDFPDAPPGISALIGGSVGESDQYTRIDTP